MTHIVIAKFLAIIMSGRGRDGKKRNSLLVSGSDIRRLARRGGLKKISKPVVEQVRMILRIFLQNVIQDAFAYVTETGEKSVTVLEVMRALKKQAEFIDDFETY